MASLGIISRPRCPHPLRAGALRSQQRAIRSAFARPLESSRARPEAKYVPNRSARPEATCCISLQLSLRDPSARKNHFRTRPPRKARRTLGAPRRHTEVPSLLLQQSHLPLIEDREALGNPREMIQAARTPRRKRVRCWPANVRNLSAVPHRQLVPSWAVSAEAVPRWPP